MAAIDALFDWLPQAMGPVLSPKFMFIDGGVPSNKTTPSKFMCVVQGRGGPAPDAGDRRPNYRVILMGPEKSRSDVASVRATAEAIMQAILDESTPCGMAGIRAMGEPVGPAYTAEDRAWMSLELQLIH